jgi:C-terminal processing protease CtpA/Prc
MPAEQIVISPPPGASDFDAGVVRVLRQPECRGAGVGLYSRSYVQGTFVEKAYADTSAARAGIEFGDRVVAINGKDVSTLGPRAVDLLLMGDAGSTVAVTVWSRTSNARRTVNLVRAAR